MDSKKFLRRSHISELMAPALENGRVLLNAGHGYGKTAAIEDFVNQNKITPVWLKLTELDNDPGYFLSRFVNLVGINDQNTTSDFTCLKSGIKELVKKTSGLLIIIDDYGHIKTDEVLNFIKFLFLLEIDGFGLIISGSCKDFYDLNAEKEYVLITEKDLKFSLKDIRGLLSLYGLNAYEDNLHKLLNYTEGWPIALRLICEASKDGAFSFQLCQAYAAEFFEREYYGNYNKKLRILLIKLSFFPSFSVKLFSKLNCENIEKAVEIIARNPFVYYDFDKMLFRFHNLYREFLSYKKDYLTDSQQKDLNKASGEQSVKTGDLKEALDRFLVAGDNNMADFCRAYLLLDEMEIKKSEALLKKLVKTIEGGAAENKAMLGTVFITLSLISLAKGSGEGIGFLKKALLTAPDIEKVQNSKLMILGNSEVFFLTSYKEGQLEKDIDYMFEFAAISEAMPGGGLCGLECLYAGEAMYFTNNLSKASEYAYKAAFKAISGERHDIALNAYCLLMRINLFSGNLKQAESFLSNIVNFEGSSKYSAYPELKEWSLAYFSSFITKFEKEPRPSISQMNRLLVSSPYGLARRLTIMARKLISKKCYSEALGLLARLDWFFSQRSLLGLKLEMYILRGGCYVELGRREEAVECFHRAYALSYANKITVPFAELGILTLRLIDASKASRELFFDRIWLESIQNISQSCVRRQSAMNKGAKSGFHGETKVSLTEKELNILTMLSKGMTRDEIANLQGISVNGVKKHITAIYTKLGAVNRADAMYIAISKGLIE